MEVGRGANGINVGTGERWISLVAGTVLAAYGLRRRSPGGLALAVAGGFLTYRGATGHCSAYSAAGISTADDPNDLQGIHVLRTVTVERTPEDLYAFWHDLSNLPRFMSHLTHVEVLDAQHSHWVARGPAGRSVEWDAEVTEDRPNRLIAWRSLPTADVQNAGSVTFAPAPVGRGTEVRVELHYMPPGGAVGALVAKLFGEEPAQQVADDLRRFKAIAEAGEVPTTYGQPAGPTDVRDAPPAMGTNVPRSAVRAPVS